MSDSVQMVNYCTHAIEDMRAFSKNAATLMPISARRVRVLSDMLVRATKFLLPNCAELVDPCSLNDAHLDLLRLPYPVTAFEAPWMKESDGLVLNGEVESPSTRRIALCWELSDDFEPFAQLNETVRPVFPDGGVFIYPISYSDELRCWNPGLGGQFVPRDYRCGSNFEDLPASTIVHDALRNAGQLNEKGFRFRSEPFVLLDEPFAQLLARKGNDVPTGLSHVIYDSNDEVTMTVQACAVLNCANVETVDVAPGKGASAKRAATGKPPFFTYKVLQLSPGKSGSTGRGGSHAGPRTHLRRGHIRRLADRTTWVRAALINPGSERGAVVKDYEIPKTV
jgi:hypothetical protein